jgi:hypothetical protein
MRILATVSNMRSLAVVVDLRTREVGHIPVLPGFFDPTITERATCRPFGITWSPDELFIVNNRQLLAFGHDLTFSRTVPVRLQVNTHQLAYDAGRAWTVSPWTNSLIGVGADDTVEFDLAAQTVRPYVERDASSADDRWHYNSLLWHGDRLFVAAHGFGPASFINVYDRATFRLVDVHPNAGHSIHGLARRDGELFWISTKTKEIRSDRGRRLRLPRAGFARGFAMTDDHFIVGVSVPSPRDKRHRGDSWIQVIDHRDGRLVEEVSLPGTGNLNDLRLLDAPDHAHPVPPFWP